MQIDIAHARLEVDVSGPADGPPLLLIMGLGMPLIGWHEGLVAQLVERGFRVIRFDNRDSGRSQHFDALGTPPLGWQALRYFAGLSVRSPYRLADMAADAAGLLDALDIDRAHVCGASMGGMIAQRLAIARPQRVRSLSLMMTTSGARGLPQPSMRVQAALLRQPRRGSTEAVVEHYMRLFRCIGSPAYQEPEDALRRFCERLVERRSPGASAGFVRQMSAIVADTDRTPELAALRLPTLVLHGEADPLLPVGCAHQLAAAIPSARLQTLPGMGHDLPAPLWPVFAEALASVAAQAD